MKHWKTTLGGVIQFIGWILLGIALYADMAGLRKSYTLEHTGIIGCIIIGLGVLIHAWNAADKPKE